LIWEVDSIYAEVITSKDPVKYALQQFRDKIVDEAIESHFNPKKAYPILQNPWFSHIEWLVFDFFNPKDKHNYYLYINILSPNFGLTHSYGAITDQMAMQDKIYDCVMRWWNRRAVKEIKGKYTKEKILEVASSKMDASVNVISHLSLTGVFKVK
jgi:hypothetical protein